MNDPEDSLQTLFLGALEIADPHQRMDFLSRACGGDTPLSREVEELLAAEAASGGFLPDQPAAAGSRGIVTSLAETRMAGSALTTAQLTERSGGKIGRYRLLQVIGEGGCGVVYMAEQETPIRRKVALKVIKLGMDTKQVIARFEAERQALALMDHPNIAKVLDAGATGSGRPFFVMELVQGIPITRYCDENQLGTCERVELFIRVCAAVQHAHQKGIVHRDIKPSNILVTLRDGLSMPKVIDFGIAKAIEQKLTERTFCTELNQFLGTPAYMSPEQVEMSGLDIDTRADIYSLGGVLYELLTGQTPFDAKDLVQSGLDELRKTIREVEPPRPSVRLSTLPREALTLTAQAHGTDGTRLVHRVRGDLDWIVMKCLEKDRTRRYETANGLAADLKRHLVNEPVVARPPSPAYRLQKSFRRHRLVFTAAGAVALALLLGIGLSLWQAAVATRALERESRTGIQLRVQISKTETARQAAERAAASELQQRVRIEGLLQRMQIQTAEYLFEAAEEPQAVAYLGQVLRANPSNEVAASRLVAALLRPFGRPVVGPLEHGHWVAHAEFSPDGTRIVTGSWDNTARVWDARTGKALSAPLPHGDAVWFAAFSPDGLRVVTGCSDRSARLWDARTGEPVFGPLRHPEKVGFARFSPDGARLVTVSDRSAWTWDARTGQSQGEPFVAGGVISSVAFTSEGLRVLVMDQEVAQIWNAETGKPMSAPLRHARAIKSAQFSPDGLRAVTASVDKTARVWDVFTSRPLTDPLMHRDTVRSAEFSADGLRVVTASDDKTARVWDAWTGRPLTEPLRHDQTVNFAQFSPDGLSVVTASDDTTAWVWSIRAGQPPTEPLPHKAEVRRAVFSPDGLRVVTASEDTTAQIWEARTGRPVTPPLRHDGGVVSAQFSPDGRWVVTASRDATAKVWDAHSGILVAGPLRHDGAVFSARFSPDGLRVVTASEDMTAQIWEAGTGRRVTPPFRHEGGVLSAQFSPDGRQVVTASADKTARVWDAITGLQIAGPFQHDRTVNFAQFSPDGTRIVTASKDKTARFWDVHTGQAVGNPLRHEAGVITAEFSPNGQWLVTASDGRTAQVWDVQSGQHLAEPLRHTGRVKLARFSPGGLRVVTAAADGISYIWDARTGLPLGEPLSHAGEISGAEFSPDGRSLVTASKDQTARVWDVRPAPVPVPGWFLEWGEARVGRRFGSFGTMDAVPPGEQLRQRELVIARTNTDFFTCLAQWVESDPFTRAISPHSSLTVPEYVAYRLEQNTLSSVREAVRMCPSSSQAWARLAALELEQDAKLHPGSRAEADFSARQALRLDPANCEALQVLGAVEGN